MSDKLIIIDNLSNYMPITKEKRWKVGKFVLKGTIYSLIFLIIRAIFILPIFIFTEDKTSFIELYTQKYTYSSPSYEQIWENFRSAFSILFENNDFLVKYMIVGFIILSIILISAMKSPSGILISFVATVISPYIIKNIFVPVLSIIYVPINFFSLFIDGLFPTIPIMAVWAGVGFLIGAINFFYKKGKLSKIFLSTILVGLFVLNKDKFSLENIVQLENWF